MIRTLAVSGYRSLRDLVLPLGPLTVITGANGSGKSSLYRALRLLAECSQGAVIGSLAREGGLQSALWAGPETLGAARRGAPVQGTVRSGPVSLRLGFGADDFGYLVDLGLPVASQSAFDLDPLIKREVVFAGPAMRPASMLVRRTRQVVEVAAGRGWNLLTDQLADHRSMLSELADPAQAPELFATREQLRSWRFYDGFRADATAPARQVQVGTRTPVLADDGADLAAAAQTIFETGRTELADAVADAFDGAVLKVAVNRGMFDLTLRQPGMLRPLRAAELSDGTLRYLLWAVALLTPQPPPLMVLNEPETSLHPDLLPALGRLIVKTARQTQVLVVSHSRALIDRLDVRALDHETDPDEPREIELVKDLGETQGPDLGRLGGPLWDWGKR